jgi:hypothetical protein
VLGGSTYVERIENITDRVWEEGHRRGSSSKQRLGIGRYGRRRRTTRQLRRSKTAGTSKSPIYIDSREIFTRGWRLYVLIWIKAGNRQPDSRNKQVCKTNPKLNTRRSPAMQIFTSTSPSTTHTANPRTMATPEPTVVIKLTNGR